MQKLFLIEHNAILTGYKFGDVKAIARNDGNIVIELADGRQTIISEQDDYEIRIVEDKQLINSIDADSTVADIQKLDKQLDPEDAYNAIKEMAEKEASEEVSKLAIDDSTLLYAGAGVLALGVAVALAGGGDDGGSSTPKDKTAPTFLDSVLNKSGNTITGKTEAGATVKAIHNGTEIGTATADADGNYSISLDKAYTNGEEIQVNATDSAGNTTTDNTVTANDTTAPVINTQAINTEGDTVTGTTEAGATVTVKDGDTVIGTATADADGNYSVTISPAKTNGETLSITATDSANNESDAKQVTAEDTTAPASLTADLNTTGDTITGTTEAGATVKAIHNGTEIGTATADADGNYSISLDQAYSNGEDIQVNATDAAGNTTKDKTVTAADTTAPEITSQAINDGGSEVSGTTEAGATVTVKDGDAPVGTATADDQGNFSVTLDKSYTNGETLTLTAKDGSNNESAAKEVTAKDTTAPATLTAAINADGNAVTGTTEAGATVKAMHDGQEIGTATADDQGNYSISLDQAYSNGEEINVSATDNVGNKKTTDDLYVQFTYSGGAMDYELQEIFATNVTNRDEEVVNQSLSSYSTDVINFSITGTGSIPTLTMSGSGSLSTSNFSYTLVGDNGYSVSGNYGNVTSLSSSSVNGYSSWSLSSLLTNSTLPEGEYTLTFTANTYLNSSNLSINQTVEVVSQDFAGYEAVTGNIFDGTTAPENYEMRVDGQAIKYIEDDNSKDSMTVNTDNGVLTLKANGDYSYKSNATKQGLTVEQLSEEINVVVYDLQGNQAGTYGIDVMPDVTPPEAGQLVLQDYTDTGAASDDDITNDNNFNVSVTGNEVGSNVAIEYSTDNGTTWSELAGGNASLLADGTYQYRGKVTDDAQNTSYTDIKTVTIDTTAPELAVGVDKQINFDVATDSLTVNVADDATLTATNTTTNTAITDPTNIAFAEGNYQLVASDVAGNSTTVDLNMVIAPWAYGPKDSSASIINVIKGNGTGSLAAEGTLGGNGSDIIISDGKTSEGYFSLLGRDGNDTLIYGKNSQGSIFLDGESGNDTYIVDVNNFNGSESNFVAVGDDKGSNTLYLSNVSPDVLSISRDSDTNRVFLSTETSDWKVVVDYGYGIGLDNIYFDNGTVWTNEYINSII